MPYLPPMAQNAEDISAIERNGVWQHHFKYLKF
jgi:hypothetical protein